MHGRLTAPGRGCYLSLDRAAPCPRASAGAARQNSRLPQPAADRSPSQWYRTGRLLPLPLARVWKPGLAALSHLSFSGGAPLRARRRRRAGYRRPASSSAPTRGRGGIGACCLDPVSRLCVAQPRPLPFRHNGPRCLDGPLPLPRHLHAASRQLCASWRRGHNRILVQQQPPFVKQAWDPHPFHLIRSRGSQTRISRA